MALSPETKKLREEREEMSRELHNPTPEERAEEERYWRENVALRVQLDKARMAQAAKLERLRKGHRPPADKLVSWCREGESNPHGVATAGF
jgi:hypothetical protein